MATQDVVKMRCQINEVRFERALKLMARSVGTVIQKGMLWLIRCYQQWISPLLPPACRFYPTCSEYLYQATATQGLRRGLKLGLVRVMKCHPFHPGGYDPVPKRGR